MEMLRITGGRVLLRPTATQMVDLAIEDGRIAGIGRDGRGADSTRAACWCFQASSISMAMRSSGSCSRVPGSVFPPMSRCTIPRRSFWPTASLPRFMA